MKFLSDDGLAAIFIQFADPALRERLFARMVRCLKSGGVLVLHGYTPKQVGYRTGGPPLLSHLYTEEQLSTAVADLAIQKLRNDEGVVTEGKGHQGRSALVGLVAQRSEDKP